MPHETIQPSDPNASAAASDSLVQSAESSATLGWHRRLLSHLSPAQFGRYLCVGIFNTIFGYGTFVTALTLLNNVTPQRFLYLTVIVASIVTTPFNITVAYFGYKLFVFRTKGNYLSEWLKCFAVYGTSMIPGLLALSALTRLLQSLIHRHAAALRPLLFAVESHLTGRAFLVVHHAATGKSMAGYVAGALMTGFTTISSFIGHKKVTFRERTS